MPSCQVCLLVLILSSHFEDCLIRQASDSMLRCMTTRAFTTAHPVPICATTAACRSARHYCVVNAHEPSKPPSEPEQQLQTPEQQFLHLADNVTKEYTTFCEQMAAATQKARNNMDWKLRMVTKELAEHVDTYRQLSSDTIRQRLWLEVGNRAVSNSSFRTTSDWLRRMAAPLQDADISLQTAETAIIENLLKVSRSCLPVTLKL